MSCLATEVGPAAGPRRRGVPSPPQNSHQQRGIRYGRVRCGQTSRFMTGGLAGRPMAGGMTRETPVPDLADGHGDSPIEVVPVVVLSQTFPARPSWIPEIRDFVRRCLAESPLTDQGTREVGETVFRALLDAAGPEGAIQVSFRIFPEHVEVDVLHSNQPVANQPVAAEPMATTPAAARPPPARGRDGSARAPGRVRRLEARPAAGGRTHPGSRGPPARRV